MAASQPAASQPTASQATASQTTGSQIAASQTAASQRAAGSRGAAAPACALGRGVPGRGRVSKRPGPRAPGLLRKGKAKQSALPPHRLPPGVPLAPAHPHVCGKAPSSLSDHQNQTLRCRRGTVTPALPRHCPATRPAKHRSAGENEQDQKPPELAGFPPFLQLVGEPVRSPRAASALLTSNYPSLDKIKG